MRTLNLSELRHAVGQLLIGGFTGRDIPSELERLVHEGSIGGVILFARNIESVEGIAVLLRRLASLPLPTEWPLLFAVDQEGGRVQRLRAPFPELPSMRLFGQAGDASLVRLAGRIVGEGLRRVGFHQNYAPVLDVDLNPDNPVIGDRSFGRDARVVATMGASFIAGLQATGVAACGKHFPGHGDTSTDSHLELPSLPHGWERLRDVELQPFRAAIAEGVAAIMTAHVLFPALDQELPATLSPHVLDRLVRQELGYEGVVVSDDLEMKAIAAHWGVADAAVLAVRAGCDQLLICHHLDRLEEAHAALVSAVETGHLAEARVVEAARRVQSLKRQYVRPEMLEPLTSTSSFAASLDSPAREALLRSLLEVLQETSGQGGQGGGQGAGLLTSVGVDPTERS